MIHTLEDTAVDESLDLKLRALLTACFPHEPEFVKHRYFLRPPLRHWYIAGEGDSLIDHACIHRRTIGTPAGDMLIGGVGDVCVLPAMRGKGLVRQILAEAHRWLETQGYDFAMLFGRREVYQSSGYFLFTNPIRYRDLKANAEVVTPFESAMVRPVRPDAVWPAEGEIDLRGPTF